MKIDGREERGRGGTRDNNNSMFKAIIKSGLG
jgi:hypothetical protein